MQILTLHRESSRHAYFARPERRTPFFESGLNCWVVSDPEDAETVLQSRSFDVVTLHTAYENFENVSGHAFPNLVFALRHIPLGLNDETHRDIRRKMAELIARRRAEVARCVPELVEKWFGLVQRRAEVELVGEVLSPLVAEFIGVLTETAVPDGSACQRVSIVFDPLIGLRTRRELDAEIGLIRSVIRASRGPDVSEVEEGLRLALFALGTDSLVGTIGESLHRLFEDHRGTALDSIPFPEWPLETGVPFLERIVTEPVEVGGANMSPGERVRILMQGFAYSLDPVDRERIFGAGVHSCLGRQMSVDLWRAIAARLSRMRVFVDVVDHALRMDNYVFTCPARLTLRMVR